MAAVAESYWRTYLPDAFADIADPGAFFQTLEEEAMAQIADLELELRGPDRPGETFVERMGRFRWARHVSEQLIYPEVLMPTPTPASGSLPDATDGDFEAAVRE